MSNYITYKTMDVITYPGPNLRLINGFEVMAFGNILTHEQLETIQHCSYWCPGANAPGHQ